MWSAMETFQKTNAFTMFYILQHVDDTIFIPDLQAIEVDLAWTFLIHFWTDSVLPQLDNACLTIMCTRIFILCQ